MNKMLVVNSQLDLPFGSDVVSRLVDLAYTGTCQVTESTITSLISMANMFQLDSLTRLCGDFLVSSADISSVLQHLQLADQHLCSHVTDKLWQFIFRNFHGMKDQLTNYPVTELVKFL